MNKVKLVVKVMIIGLICMVGSFVNANPNTNPYYESVEELLLIMKIDENLSNSLAQIRPMILQQFQQATPEEMTPEQVQVMEKFIGRLLDLMEEEMRWEKIKDDYIQVYMSIYTEEEIQELIVLPDAGGTKTIDQMPIRGKINGNKPEVSDGYVAEDPSPYRRDASGDRSHYQRVDKNALPFPTYGVGARFIHKVSTISQGALRLDKDCRGNAQPWSKIRSSVNSRPLRAVNLASRSWTVMFSRSFPFRSRMIFPRSIMIVRFPMVRACFRSWVTISTVNLCCATMRLVISTIWMAVFGSRAAVYSSKRRIWGWPMVAMSRVRACRCPPESNLTGQSRRSSRPSSRRARRRLNSARRFLFNPNFKPRRFPRFTASERFSSIVISAAVPCNGSWKTRPTRWARLCTGQRSHHAR